MIMKSLHYTHEQLVNIALFSSEDIEQTNQRRRGHNRLGFGYQLTFVRLLNRFPTQKPFEVLEDILSFVSVQLNIPSYKIDNYAQRQPTISSHREIIMKYLGLKRLGNDELSKVKLFIFEYACRTEQSIALTAMIEMFLKEQGILKPADDSLQRIIIKQRQEAKRYINEKIWRSLSDTMMHKLDMLITTEEKQKSDFYFLKKPPGRPSPASIIKLTNKIEQIKATGILELDLSWLNNNFQRSLTHYAKRCDANRLRELEPKRRYAVLTCFSAQFYRDTVDHLVDMFNKLINKVYNHARVDVDNHNKSQRKKIQESLKTFKSLTELIFDPKVKDKSLRQTLFKEIGRELLFTQKEAVEVWLNGKHSHTFNLVRDRFSYIRQFSPSLLKHIQFKFENDEKTSLDKAITILREMNADNKRKLPDDPPTSFIPKKIRPLVVVDGKIDKGAWECALLTAVRDEIKSGNISIERSKRFGRLDDFFISKNKWQEKRRQFFECSGLPENPNDVKNYLTE